MSRGVWKAIEAKTRKTRIAKKKKRKKQEEKK